MTNTQHLIFLTNSDDEQATVAMLVLPAISKARSIEIARSRGFENFNVVERIETADGDSELLVATARGGVLTIRGVTTSKPTVAQDAIATADSYLQNAVLPTYSELRHALAGLLSHCANRGVATGSELDHSTVKDARALLDRAASTLSGKFGA